MKPSQEILNFFSRLSLRLDLEFASNDSEAQSIAEIWLRKEGRTKEDLLFALTYFNKYRTFTGDWTVTGYKIKSTFIKAWASNQSDDELRSALGFFTENSIRREVNKA